MRTARFSLAIILALLAWSAPAAAQTKVKFVLDWQVQGPHPGSRSNTSSCILRMAHNLAAGRHVRRLSED